MRRVVVVSKEAEYEHLGAVLAEAGCEAAFAANATEAARAARQAPPALVIVDHAASAAEVNDALFLLKQDPGTAGIPRLLLCERKVASLVDSLDTDADLVLEKPLDPGEFAAALYCLLRPTAT